MGLDHDLRVEARDLPRRRDRLGYRLARIVLVKKRLPLQVAGFDVVAVEDPQRPDAGTRQQRSQRRSGSAASHAVSYTHLDVYKRQAYRNKFSGKYDYRLITGGVGHNIPQEAPQAFAQAVIDVDHL